MNFSKKLNLNLRQLNKRFSSKFHCLEEKLLIIFIMKRDCLIVIKDFTHRNFIFKISKLIIENELNGIMDPLSNLPELKINPSGEISRKFLELGIKTFKEACLFVHEMEYGYNSNKDNKMILFIEKKGTCTTKHAVIASLAEELKIPLYKKVGIYKLTETIVTGTNEILKKNKIPYVPMIHCFLIYKQYRFDLTEGNKNGKNTSIEKFIHEEKVIPFITEKDEYLLFLKVLQEKVLPSKEMVGIDRKTILKAREEALVLLKKAIQ